MFNSKSRLAARLSIGLALALSTLSLTSCADPMESLAPFSSGDVPVDAKDIDCSAPQGDAPSEVPGETAVVLAPTNNFVRFTNAISSAESDIHDRLNVNGSQIATVLANSSPTQKFQSWVNLTSSFEADRVEEIDGAIGQVRLTYFCAVMLQNQNKSAYATSEGADFFAGLQTASQTFTHPSAKHTIIVIGNGLQDVGQVDFSKALPQDSAAAKSIVASLDAKGALPDLTGIEVIWHGLGQTNPSLQEPLHPIAMKALEAFWTELIEAAGGELVKVVKTIPYADPVSTSIQVKPIDVPAPPCVFMLTSDDGFNFKPDSADFLDAAKARKGAENMAAEIEKSECSGPLYVVGYAASGVDKKQYNSGAIARVKSLSAARAAAFKGLLEQSGVKIKLVPVGAGKGPTTDWDLNGKFVEDMGKQNRFVEITQSKPEAD